MQDTLSFKTVMFLRIILVCMSKPCLKACIRLTVLIHSFQVTVPSGCWVLFQEPFSQVVPYVRRATEGNPNVKNDVIFDEGRLV